MNDTLGHKWATFMLEAPEVLHSLQCSSKNYPIETNLGELEEFLMILLAYNIPGDKQHDLFMFIILALPGVNVQLNWICHMIWS